MISLYFRDALSIKNLNTFVFFLFSFVWVSSKGKKTSGMYAAAEKDDEGMALKILTRAEDMPNGREPIFILLGLLAF
jgi:hypothetical protein